jgi:hypothetical protein
VTISKQYTFSNAITITKSVSLFKTITIRNSVTIFKQHEKNTKRNNHHQNIIEKIKITITNCFEPLVQNKITIKNYVAIFKTTQEQCPLQSPSQTLQN